MKHLIATAAAALLLAAGAASAAEVSVSIGPELQKNTKAYGARDVEMLRKDLADYVQRALAKPGAAPLQRVDLVLESATPNHPTFNELVDQPGLSLLSVGLGGAAITGTVTGADGVAKPVSYRWHEIDLHQVVGYTTWTDANSVFDRFALEIARGKLPNDGPYHPDLTSYAAFDSQGRYR
ncbi:MAG TPA: hypothetical protein VL358_01595 [Caulobacteraceae bacterium]|jgi:hypothetical protein|nr:hypothetical protein [Caulobacteraceae bacterium]